MKIGIKVRKNGVAYQGRGFYVELEISNAFKESH